MATAPAAIRNLCFAVIAAIETDLRDLILSLAQVHRKQDLLPDDVRSNAIERWRSDTKSTGGAPSEGDIALLQYSDFADIAKVLESRFSSSPLLGPTGLAAIKALVSNLNPIRHRVCHSRPLEPDDLPMTL